MKLAQRIRDIREDNDLSQTEVATKLRTSQTVYSRYERGERALPVNYLYTLCEIYNISADYLLGLSDEPRPLK